ncbi:MAG: disulfide bond formation protein B [Lysobacter sp.]
MNPFKASFRIQYLLGFLACVGLLAFAFYLQIYQHLEPCPLCIFQRVAFAALGVVFLIGGLHGPKKPGGRRSYGVLALLASLAGIAVAGNHVRLQHLPPDQVPACGPGLNYMVEAMPLAAVVKKVMTGSGECAAVDWTFLGLGMPAWSLTCFIVLALWAAYAAFRAR